MPTAAASAAIAASMSEDQLLANVIDAAQKLGWRVAHFRPAKTERGWRTAVQGDGKGFPDLVMVNRRMGEVVYAELKAQRGVVSPEQREWLEALTEAGQRAYVWRPCDWMDGTVQRILEGVE